MTPADPSLSAVAVPATTIGRYQVVSRLGEGGMGTLYLAWDPKLERQVAIKLLRGDDEDLRKRFAREARSIARLRHPHIVTIFDVGDHESQPFIAMEYIQGQTLASMIRNRVQLRTDEKLRLMEELCDGLGFAHRQRIVHRDVKPANLMVDHDGLLKVLDFGIARNVESGITQTGMLVGTANYMSPEQMSGQPVDSRSDIFAVGVLFYEFLSYRMAFPGGFDSGLFYKILNQQPEPLENVCRNLDPEIPRIITRCIEKDPAKRYQDLAAMRKELQSVRARLESASEASTQIAEPITDEKAARGVQTPAPIRRTAEIEQIEKRRAAEIQKHLDAGYEAFESGNLENAITCCEHALLLDPYDPRALDLLDRSKTRLEEHRAQEWLNERLQEARTASDQRRYAEALRVLDEISERMPHAPGVEELRATTVDARTRFEEQERRNREIEEGLKRAVDCITARDWAGARQHAGAVLTIDAANRDARDLFDAAVHGEEEDQERQQVQRQQREIEERLKRATQSVAARDWEGASQEVAAVLALDAANRGGLDIRAAVARGQEEDRKREQIERQRRDIEDRLKSANDSIKARDWAGARQQAGAILALDAGNRAALDVRAAADRGEEDERRQKTEKERQARLAAAVSAIDAQLSRGDLDGAAAALDRATRELGSSAELRDLRIRLDQLRRLSEPPPPPAPQPRPPEPQPPTLEPEPPRPSWWSRTIPYSYVWMAGAGVAAAAVILAVVLNRPAVPAGGPAGTPAGSRGTPSGGSNPGPMPGDSGGGGGVSGNPADGRGVDHNPDKAGGDGKSAAATQVLTIKKPAGGTLLLGNDIKCGTSGANCSFSYPSGGVVELRYQADPGFVFGAFTDDCARGGRVTMDGPRVCGATFRRDAPPTNAVNGASWLAPLDQRQMLFVAGTPSWTAPDDPDSKQKEAATPVRIAGYWLDTLEVTNQAYRSFVLAMPEWKKTKIDPKLDNGSYLKSWIGDDSYAPGTDQLPVNYVNWSAANAYCGWADKRLPDDSEWEYAARAGSRTRYWWGNDIDESDADRANFGSQLWTVGHPKARNHWGFFDMLGNVLEWTSSKAVRGGSYYQAKTLSSRIATNPQASTEFIGFRCARSR